MENQQLAAPPTDLLPRAGPVDEINVELGLFPVLQILGHLLAAPDVDHQIVV
jgi:hypothetical protein